jgi:hypothetical protein
LIYGRNLAREVANLDHRGLTVRIGGQLMSGVAILLDKPRLPILKSKWVCRYAGIQPSA